MNENQKEKKIKSGEIKDKEKIIKFLLEKYGKEIFSEKDINAPVLSTGSLILNEAIGGGYLFGRMTEIFGLEASGKTTLCLHAIKECQKRGERAAYLDIENSFDPKRAKKIGIILEDLILISNPSCGEEALEIIIDLIKSKEISLIILDSIAALTPKSEIEGNLEEQRIGAQAMMIAKGLRRINFELSRSKVVMIFVNQIRIKISSGNSFVSSEITTGGVSLNYIASLRIRLKEIEKIEEEGEIIGIRTLVRVKKNRNDSPYQEEKLEITFKKGIIEEREIIDLAVKLNIIKKTGGWYNYEGVNIGNGKKNASRFLEENKKIKEQIKKVIEEKIEEKKDNKF